LSRAQNPLLDHLVGAHQEGLGNGQAERLGGFHVDDQLDLGRLFDRKVRRFGAPENFVDVVTGAAEQIDKIRSVGGNCSAMTTTSMISSPAPTRTRFSRTVDDMIAGRRRSDAPARAGPAPAICCGGLSRTFVSAAGSDSGIVGPSDLQISGNQIARG
jgi:hypothetical protein